MGLVFIYNESETKLDEEEKDGLIIQSITTCGEFDKFEQQNIENVIQWSLTKRFKLEQNLFESFINGQQKIMYRNVWKWAGEYQKKIGVEKLEILVLLS